MRTELFQAVLVDVLDTAYLLACFHMLPIAGRSVHAGGASGHLAALLHALELSAAVCLSLAHHIIVIVGLASRTNKVGRAQKRGGTGTQLGHLGDVIRERGGIDESLLIEPGIN